MIILLPVLFRTCRFEWIKLLQNFIYSYESLWKLEFTLLINCPLKSINFLNFYLRSAFMFYYSPSFSSSSFYFFVLLLKLLQTEKLGSIYRIVQGYFRAMQQFLHLHTFFKQGHLHESDFWIVSIIFYLQISTRQSKQNFFQQEVA